MIDALVNAILVIVIQCKCFAASSTESIIFVVWRCLLWSKNGCHTRCRAGAWIAIVLQLFLGQAKLSNQFVCFGTGDCVDNIRWTGHFHGSAICVQDLKLKWKWKFDLIFEVNGRFDKSEVVLVISWELHIFTYVFLFTLHETCWPIFPAKITSWEMTFPLQVKKKYEKVTNVSENIWKSLLTFLYWYFPHLIKNWMEIENVSLIILLFILGKKERKKGISVRTQRFLAQPIDSQQGATFICDGCATFFENGQFLRLSLKIASRVNGHGHKLEHE